VASVTVVEEAARRPGAPHWIQPALNVTPGRDPLGLQTITLDRIMPRLLPGILRQVLIEMVKNLPYRHALVLVTPGTDKRLLARSTRPGLCGNRHMASYSGQDSGRVCPLARSSARLS
jgi:hypothetical protein